MDDQTSPTKHDDIDEQDNATKETDSVTLESSEDSPASPDTDEDAASEADPFSVLDSPAKPKPSPTIENSDLSDITSDQITELKSETVEYAKAYAKTGASTRKEPSPDLANDQGPYTWWEQQASFESNTWSVSLWEYDNKHWQLQATKVELKSDGHSRMTAYSMRKDTDTSFPGFQVYKEQSDDRYHPAAIEDIVYLNRVLKSLHDSAK